MAERFFAEFFGFLFDNTSQYYLVFASLFPYSCALLLLFVVHVYALESLSVYYTSFTLVPHLDKLEYMNNKRPSKPSLPHVFEPSKLLLPIELTKP